MSIVTLLIVVVILIILVVIAVIYMRPPCETPGAFKDVTLGQCFLCPPGTTRSLSAVTAADACVADCPKMYPNAPRPTGSFGDVNKCWHCPQGYVRTLDPVYSNTACKVGDCKTVFGADAGWVGYDAINGGGCWKCPRGYSRTWDPVTSKTACATGIGGATTSAVFLGKGHLPAVVDGPMIARATPVK